MFLRYSSQHFIPLEDIYWFVIVSYLPAQYIKKIKGTCCNFNLQDRDKHKYYNYFITLSLYFEFILSSFTNVYIYPVLKLAWNQMPSLYCFKYKCIGYIQVPHLQGRLQPWTLNNFFCFLLLIFLCASIPDNIFRVVTSFSFNFSSLDHNALETSESWYI